MNLLQQAITILLYLFLSLNGLSQNLIGKTDEEIKQYMKENQKAMDYIKILKNSAYNYLKYTDKDQMQTLIFFLNEESVCTGERLVCDKSLKAAKIKEMDSTYGKSGKNRWTDTKNGMDYILELRDAEWTFNITIQQKEKL
jgi:hypothetical protein